MGNQTYAGVYATGYQIYLFDNDFQLEKKLVSTVPKHIKPYYPYKKYPRVFDGTSQKWMESWTIMEAVYYVDNRFVLCYSQDKKNCLDIIDKEGNVLYSKLEKDKKWIVFTENSCIWWLEKTETDDEIKYTLLQSKFNF